jgi:hypothetical protein
MVAEVTAGRQPKDNLEFTTRGWRGTLGREKGHGEAVG